MTIIEREDLKKDFGLVKVDDLTDVRENIRKHMDANGYNVDKCDICNVINQGPETFFKFVHYSVPTMATEPFYRIEFIMEI